MGRLGYGWRVFSLVAACILALSVVASASTYYIDYAAGSDSANGTSPTTPWQHMPGMQGCAANCAKTTPKAGDKIILKGGVTWPNAVFPITWTWNGSSGSYIYIGVDKTWYAGSSWARPIFNAGGTPITGSMNAFIKGWAISYVQWDNLEITGFNTNISYPTGYCATFNAGTYVTVSNWYVHGWSHTGVTEDGFHCLWGGATPTGDIIEYSVFDGSDSTGGGDSGGMTYTWPTVIYSIFHDMPNAVLLNGHGEVGNNLIYNIKADFDGVTHANAIETLGGDGGNYYIHDNLIHDVSLGEPMFLGGQPMTVYVWNNVIWNIPNASTWMDARFSNWTGYYFNNTIVPYPGNPCFVQGGTTYNPTFTLENNHCITTGAFANVVSSNLTLTTNVVMTPTQAAAAGYSVTQTNVYSPTSSNCSGQRNCPVGVGTNATSVWPSGYSTNDTSYSCTQSAANQVVCPARTTALRSTRWDAGAYLYSASGGGPARPTNLRAAVH